MLLLLVLIHFVSTANANLKLVQVSYTVDISSDKHNLCFSHLRPSGLVLSFFFLICRPSFCARDKEKIEWLLWEGTERVCLAELINIHWGTELWEGFKLSNIYSTSWIRFVNHMMVIKAIIANTACLQAEIKRSKCNTIINIKENSNY